MDVIHFNQKQLAARWQVSEATLEGWRSRGVGPKFLKLPGRVLYRICDIEAYEESCISTSTARRNSVAVSERLVEPLLQPLDRNWRQRVQALIDDVDTNRGETSADRAEMGPFVKRS